LYSNSFTTNTIKDLFIVCYSGEGCYYLDDGSDCVAGLIDDVYFEMPCADDQ